MEEDEGRRRRWEGWEERRKRQGERKRAGEEEGGRGEEMGVSREEGGRLEGEMREEGGREEGQVPGPPKSLCAASQPLGRSKALRRIRQQRRLQYKC